MEQNLWLFLNKHTHHFFFEMSPSKKLKEFPSGISSRVFPFASTAIKNPVSASPLMITESVVPSSFNTFTGWLECIHSA